MIALFESIARISWPYVLCALAGLASERAGVINLALEGFLLLSAFATTVLSLWSGSGTVGVFGAIVVTFVGCVALAFGQERRLGHPVLLGIALNLAIAGSCRFLLKIIYGSAANSPRLQNAPPLALVSVCALIGVGLYLERGVTGLRQRAAGENPHALSALSLSPFRQRLWAMLFCALLLSLAGSLLVFSQGQYTDGMSAGRGYIAVASVVFGRLKLWPTLAVCLLFGAAEAAQLWAQGRVHVAAQALQALPYVLCLVALGIRRRTDSAH